jgi:hypothetical protein
METIPEVKIEGLEEALERFRALSGEIDRLTESARTATTFLRDLHEQLGLSVLEPSGDSSSSGGGVHAPTALSFVDQISTAITTSLVPSLDALDEGIAAALSGFLLPEFDKLRAAFSDDHSKLAEATRKLESAVDTLSGKLGSFSYPVISGVPSSKEDRDVILGSLHRLETEWSFSEAADLASLLTPLAATGPAGAMAAGVWAAAIMGYWAIDQLMGDSVKPIDDTVTEGDRRLDRVMRYDNIEEFKGPHQATEVGRRHSDISTQILWFQDQIKAADAEAEIELDPLAKDAPGTLLRKENAAELRRQLAEDYLAALEHYKIATGLDAGWADQKAIEIAKQAATQDVSAGQEIAPFTGVPMLPLHWEPITMEIKVLSDYKLSMRTNNPNPGLRVNVDLRSGVSGMFNGRAV